MSMSQKTSGETVPFVYAANNWNGVLCGEVIRALGYRPSALLLHPRPHIVFQKNKLSSNITPSGKIAPIFNK